jgi:predicted RNase H-like HicB family nuclease
MLDLGEKIIHRARVTVIVEPDDGGFHAYAPALEGLHVDGKTKDEALENAVQAITVYLDSLSRHEDPFPIGPDLTLDKEAVSAVPVDAFMHNVTVKWGCDKMSGTK